MDFARAFAGRASLPATDQLETPPTFPFTRRLTRQPLRAGLMERMVDAAPLGLTGAHAVATRSTVLITLRNAPARSIPPCAFALPSRAGREIDRLVTSTSLPARTMT